MGYNNPPWKFKGRALYQLNLIKASEARKHVPQDLKLVELFGYTLGGIYLARYEDSPAGVFDEMVALGGLVWNAPTSCAWAARVYVNDKSARNHGVKTCGLPSRVAKFDVKDKDKKGWWHLRRAQPEQSRPIFSSLVYNRLVKGEVAQPMASEPKQTEQLDLKDERGSSICSLALPPPSPNNLGPRIRLALPSFSGRTKDHPDMLKYSLQLNANTRLSKTIEVTPRGSDADGMSMIFGGKPVVCIAFDDMEMSVGKPEKHVPKTQPKEQPKDSRIVSSLVYDRLVK